MSLHGSDADFADAEGREPQSVVDGDNVRDAAISTENDPDTQDEENESLPIGFLIKFVKPFDGTRDELSSFISDCNKAIALANVRQKYILLDYIQTQICGKAKAACVNRNFQTWDELKTFLKTMYQDSKHYAQLLCELTKLSQQQSETISQFVLRVETCLKRTINATQQQTSDPNILSGKLEMLNEIALNRFIYFTSPGISNTLRIRDIKSLNEAISLAINEEKVQKMYSLKRTSKYCTNCKNSSHNTVDCRSKRVYQVTESKTVTDSKIQNKNFSKQKICNYCKFKGHTIDECRKRKFNNENKQNLASLHNGATTYKSGQSNK